MPIRSTIYHVTLPMLVDILSRDITMGWEKWMPIRSTIYHVTLPMLVYILSRGHDEICLMDLYNPRAGQNSLLGTQVNMRARRSSQINNVPNAVQRSLLGQNLLNTQTAKPKTVSSFRDDSNSQPNSDRQNDLQHNCRSTSASTLPPRVRCRSRRAHRGGICRRRDPRQSSSPWMELEAEGDAPVALTVEGAAGVCWPQPPSTPPREAQQSSSPRSLLGEAQHEQGRPAAGNGAEPPTPSDLARSCSRTSDPACRRGTAPPPRGTPAAAAASAHGPTTASASTMGSRREITFFCLPGHIERKMDSLNASSVGELFR